MAQVDFSNAVLECIPQANFYQFGNNSTAYWGLECSGGTAYYPLRIGHDSDDPYASQVVADFDVVTKTNNTTTVRMEDGFKVIKSGVFSASGNYFFLMGNNVNAGTGNTPALWKVSNIQYNADDDYSFEITVRVNNVLQVEISNSVS